jgi:hypothetical protein
MRMDPIPTLEIPPDMWMQAWLRSAIKIQTQRHFPREEINYDIILFWWILPTPRPSA